MSLAVIASKILVRKWWFGMRQEDRPRSFSVSDIDKIVPFGIRDVQIGLAIKALGFRKIRVMNQGVREYRYEPFGYLHVASSCAGGAPSLSDLLHREGRVPKKPVSRKKRKSTSVSGQLLRAWRKEHGKTQAWLARETGIEQALISKYETGTVPMPVNARRIEVATGGQVPLTAWYPVDPVDGGSDGFAL